MRRKEPDSRGFAAALQAIGGKWKTSLLWELHLRPYRFAEASAKRCSPNNCGRWKPTG